jgi:serine protease Do
MIQEPSVRSSYSLCFVALIFFVAASFVQASNHRRTPVVDAVEKVRPAVVNIHSERTVRGPASSDMFNMTPSQNRVNGMGTGVVIDPRGYIVTNHHVVEDVNVIRVRLNDGSSYTAGVWARDPENDLALLKIDAGRALATAPLGTANDLMVGETVIAVGNAYGYEHTVTVGVVSAVKRDVTLNKEVSYKSLIQTDASINPGNSGGPLLNINGEMIGVNVAIRAGAQGISFAIPVDTMIRVASEMMAQKKRRSIWHGATCRDRLVPEGTDPKVIPSSNNGKTDKEYPGEPAAWKRELVVERIEADSPAAMAGLQTGDVIVHMGEGEVASTLDFELALLDVRPGEQVAMVVRRQGSSRRMEMVLQKADKAGPSSSDIVGRKLGMRLKPVNPDLVSRISQQLHGGLTVLEVNANGPADKSGIQKGDILVGLHQWETLTLDNVVFVLNHPDLGTFNPLTFYILRSGQVRRGWFQQID